jgi:hypothetical protein
MIEYSALTDEEKIKLIEEFLESSENLPSPENYPMTVKNMFRFFLYEKGLEVPR